MKNFLWMALFLVFCTVTNQAQNSVHFYNKIKITPASTFRLVYGHQDFNAGINYEWFWKSDSRFSWTLGLTIGGFKELPYAPASHSGTEITPIIKAIPGVKFYPFPTKRLNYALGFSAFFLNATIKEWSPFYTSSKEYRQAGILFNNYLNYNINKRIFIEAEVGWGPSWTGLFKEGWAMNTQKYPVISASHIGIGIGYAF